MLAESGDKMEWQRSDYLRRVKHSPMKNLMLQVMLLYDEIMVSGGDESALINIEPLTSSLNIRSATDTALAREHLEERDLISATRLSIILAPPVEEVASYMDLTAC